MTANTRNTSQNTPRWPILLAFFLAFSLTSTPSKAQIDVSLFYSSEFSINPGIDETPNGVVPSLLGTIGVQVDNAFSVGVVSGVKMTTLQWFGGDIAYPYVPIQADFRALLLKGKNVPVIFGRAGYAFTTSTTLPTGHPFSYIWGGWNFSAGIGYRYFFTDKWAATFHFGYEAQQTHFAHPEFEYYDHFLTIGVGFTGLAGGK